VKLVLRVALAAIPGGFVLAVWQGDTEAGHIAGNSECDSIPPQSHAGTLTFFASKNSHDRAAHNIEGKKLWRPCSSVWTPAFAGVTRGTARGIQSADNVD